MGSRVLARSRAPIHPLRGYLYVLAAAAMWGSIGLFFTALAQQGLPPLTIGMLRAGGAGLCLTLYLKWRAPDSLRPSRQALTFYALYGVVGVGLFYSLNVQAVLLTNIPTASVMLYTAPAWVTLFAWRLWGEALTRRRLLALGLALGGVALVARVYDPAAFRLSGLGLLIAAGSGLTYAIYTLFGKYGAQRYPTTPTVAYSLLFAALFILTLHCLPLAGWGDGLAGLARLAAGPEVWLTLIGMCLFPTLGSYVMYNRALTWVPASNASLVATLEPVVAALLGWLVLGQGLEPGQWVGAAFILAGAGALALES